MYTVQSYKLSYVKERSAIAAEKRTILHRRDVASFCRQVLSDAPIEYVVIVALDNANKITGYTMVSGTVNQCALYPAEVFRFLLSTNASAFIIAHNHPAGSTTASDADWRLTQELRQAGRILNIPLHDHVIIASESETVVSLRDSSRWA